nr:hypothetical protein [Nocardiopsis ansamitocini]
MGAKVNAKGELVELKFHTQKYRQMAPAELSAAVVDVIERARRQMAVKVTQAYAQFAPEGVDMDAIATGSFDPGSMLGKFDLPHLPGAPAPSPIDRQ